MTLRESIIKIIEDGTNLEIYSKVCKIDAGSIDKSKNICDVIPLDGDAGISDVRLIATESVSSGFITYPADESVVIVSFIDKDTAFVSMMTEVDEILINGGKNGGLVNIETLIEGLDKNNDILNAIIDTFSNFTPVPNDGGAALKTAMVSVLQNLSTGDFSAMEDKTIKH